jgi:DNA-binding NtrC family response regulator
MLDAHPPATATVVVLEDDEDIRRLLEQQLTASRCRVVSREQLREGGDPIDVALVDLGSLHPSTMSAVEALRRFHPRAAIVLMSGAFGDEVLERARALGAIITLQKPVNESLLAGAIVRALQRRGV